MFDISGCHVRLLHKFDDVTHALLIYSSWTDESSSQVTKPTSDLKMFSTEDEKLACIR